LQPQQWIVRSQQLVVALSGRGRLTGLAMRGPDEAFEPWSGMLTLRDCREDGDAEAESLPGGGVRWTKRWIRASDGAACRSVETFAPGPGSVSWEVTIEGEGAPWSTAIETTLAAPPHSGMTFWTACADGDPEATARFEAERGTKESPFERPHGWNDPLRPVPFTSRKLAYGAPYYRHDRPRLHYCPFEGDVFALPIATFLDEARDRGVSLILSPEDTLLDLTLDIGETGSVVFSRLFHRISGGRPVRFAMDIAIHEADWRGGLRWMTERYPAYFQPGVPGADRVAGLGAYSSHDVDFDAEKMRRMGFKVNWKASFDFPYMGMFLPPVSDDERWIRYGAGEASVPDMRAYSANMRSLGFEVLNYFNVTEFGAGITYPPEADGIGAANPASDAGAPGERLWEDGSRYLYTKLADAILFEMEHGDRPRESCRPYFTWGDAVAMDPGEPAYQRHLLEQAQAHLERLPDSAGLCIDRLDWLRLYNDRRDDGESWFDGKPVRSLNVSWRGLMEQLGPLVHGAGKVLFCNNHTKRIEMLKYIDGIFDEFGYANASLNMSALLGLFKPVLGWVQHPNQLEPDPERFFHRYLYLGVYPMAPFPGNDHSLQPSPRVDAAYLKFGPLFRALEGKKWVLEPHAVRVVAGSAIANVFRVSGGYAVPVVGGQDEPAAAVALCIGELAARPAEALRIAALLPGVDEPQPIRHRKEEGRLLLDVPLSGGCSLVRIETGDTGGGAPGIAKP
jgi:hypothetical protein